MNTPLECISRKKIENNFFSKSSNIPLILIYENKMVLEPNISSHKQIIKDDDVKECISTEEVEN